MSKNITIAGTNYNDVPSIEIPLQTSGTASFFDISDTTATASDVASGKYFYTSSGVKTLGTGSGGGTTVYTSSTGLLYTPVMTIILDMDRISAGTGYDISAILNRYGTMQYLEELTITGTVRNTNANTTMASGTVYFNVSRYPILKKVTIAPTAVKNNSGNDYDPVRNYINGSHYNFSRSNLRELVLGRLGGPYWNGAGYYRNYDEQGNSTTTVGSTDGLTLKVYVNGYKAKGGFSNSTVASNTTIIEYDYLTGEIVTG